MDNILDKIEKIAITPLRSLPIEDKTFCEEVNILFLEALAHYELMLAKVKELLPTEQKSGVVDRRYYNKVIDLSTSNYSIRTTIEAFEKSITKAKHNFAYTIANYFAKKYNLELIDKSYNVIGLKETDCTLNGVINVIFNSLNGKTFEDVGKITLLEQIKSELKYTHISVSGTSVSISDCFTLSGNGCSGSQRYMSQKDRLILILKTISLYELGSIKNLTGIFDNLSNYYVHLDVNTNTPYETVLEKVESIKFFQNGKLTIKLNNKQSANELYNLINYGTI